VLAVSLRSSPVVATAPLPDGREAEVWVGIPDDPYYVRKRELHTVVVEVRVDGEAVAWVDTLLDVDQESEARELADEIAEGLRSGSVEPRAGAIEPIVDRSS
jgi:hypothetical protein